MIAGLESISSGEIDYRGKPVTQPQKEIGMVFQEYSLLPWRTVLENVALGPEFGGVPRSQREEKVREYLRLVGMEDFSRAFPYELSGGMRQRVAIVRALANDPDVLLMDEPFGALDPINRERLQREFAELHRRLGKTVVFVTHDIEEAVLLGDRIVLMRDGRIVQSGAPEDLWRTPESDFVRDFFGDEFGLQILSRHRVSDIEAGDPPAADAPRVSPQTNLRDVLAIMVTEGVEQVAVIDSERLVGGLTFCGVVTQVRGAR